MITTTEFEFVALEEFPLAWRFTGAQHGNWPPMMGNRLDPLAAPAAARVRNSRPEQAVNPTRLVTHSVPTTSQQTLKAAFAACRLSPMRNPGFLGCPDGDNH